MAKTRVTETNPVVTKITHAEGYARFQEVLAALQADGWTRLRIDTYHKLSDGAPNPRKRWTVRHCYDHGTWELHFEPDRYWSKAADPNARRARIRTDRELPTVQAVLAELFGDGVAQVLAGV